MRRGQITLTKELLESMLGIKEGVEIKGITKEEHRETYTLHLIGDTFPHAAAGASAMHVKESLVFERGSNEKPVEGLSVAAKLRKLVLFMESLGADAEVYDEIDMMIFELFSKEPMKGPLKRELNDLANNQKSKDLIPMMIHFIQCIKLKEE